jgi:3-oxoadipate enol-lactonase
VDRTDLKYVEGPEGLQIAYALNGPEDGPCITLIHGWTGGIHEFDSIVPGLNAAGWRTLAIRVPGHEGSSSFESPDSYSMTALADTHHNVVRQLAFAPTVVLGFSLGGAIADEFAIRHPADVSALVLLGSSGFDLVDDEAQTDIDEAEPIVFDKGMEAHYDVWKKRTDSDGYETLGEEELVGRRAWWAQTSPNAYIYPLYGLRDKRDTLPELIALAKPCLIVHGDGDESPVIQSSANAAARIPSSTYRVISNASHFAQDENTSEFMKVLLEFMATIKG